MKQSHFFSFLYRAFHNSGFRFSFVLGLLIAIFQVIQMYCPINTGFAYPTSLYEMWLGGEWVSYSSSLVFVLLPITATLPFSSSLAEDRKSGYLVQMLIRQKRYAVFFQYGAASFLSGFVAAALPFLENLVLNASIYPALVPQPTTGTFSPFLRGFMIDLFYTRPLLYCLMYVLLIGIFFGSVACLGMALCFYIQSPILIHLSVSAAYLSVCYLTIALGRDSWNPCILLNPSQVTVFQLRIYLIYVIGMLTVSALLIAISGKKYECIT